MSTSSEESDSDRPSPGLEVPDDDDGGGSESGSDGDPDDGAESHTDKESGDDDDGDEQGAEFDLDDEGGDDKDDGDGHESGKDGDVDDGAEEGKASEEENDDDDDEDDGQEGTLPREDEDENKGGGSGSDLFSASSPEDKGDEAEEDTAKEGKEEGEEGKKGGGEEKRNEAMSVDETKEGEEEEEKEKEKGGRVHKSKGERGHEPKGHGGKKKKKAKSGHGHESGEGEKEGEEGEEGRGGKKKSQAKSGGGGKEGSTEKKKKRKKTQRTEEGTRKKQKVTKEKASKRARKRTKVTEKEGQKSKVAPKLDDIPGMSEFMKRLKKMTFQSLKEFLSSISNVTQVHYCVTMYARYLYLKPDPTLDKLKGISQEVTEGSEYSIFWPGSNNQIGKWEKVTNTVEFFSSKGSSTLFSAGQFFKGFVSCIVRDESKGPGRIIRTFYSNQSSQFTVTASGEPMDLAESETEIKGYQPGFEKLSERTDYLGFYQDVASMKSCLENLHCVVRKTLLGAFSNIFLNKDKVEQLRGKWYRWRLVHSGSINTDAFKLNPELALSKMHQKVGPGERRVNLETPDMDSDIIAKGWKFVLDLKTSEGLWQPHVSVRRSSLGHGGNGLFAERRFVANELFGVYTGFLAEDSDGKPYVSSVPFEKKPSDEFLAREKGVTISDYSITVMNSKGLWNVIDAKPTYSDDTNHVFLGMQYINNWTQVWTDRKAGQVGNKTNCEIQVDGSVRTLKRVDMNREFFYSYGSEHGEDIPLTKESRKVRASRADSSSESDVGE